MASYDVTCDQKIKEWERARAGRKVATSQTNVGAVAWSCDCTEAGKTVVLGQGQGRTADEAVKNACDKLWKLALQAAGEPTSARPGWSK